MTLLVALGSAQNQVAAWFNSPVTTIMVQTIPALLFAYLVRFMAVAQGTIESTLTRIRPSIEEAARSLGENSIGITRRIYLPILAPGLMMAWLMVMIDIMKELPATYLLRPYGWDTFAIYTYEMASEGMWQEAALPALALVLLGLIPVTLLIRHGSRTH